MGSSGWLDGVASFERIGPVFSILCFGAGKTDWNLEVPTLSGFDLGEISDLELLKRLNSEKQALQRGRKKPLSQTRPG